MGVRVLAVDDDPFILKVLQRYLAPEGMEVVGVASGEEALQRAAEGDIDLVILDLHLPRMDGFEVCRRLKGQEATHGIPVIMLTAAYVDPVHEQRGLEAGADAYLAKPFLRRALLYHVEAVLGGRRREAAEAGAAAGQGPRPEEAGLQPQDGGGT
ncbi:MAG: response regulator [Deltaproteobacteria bacterium]|nr:MAG: response regulator [Deltaproteobacteria bacterium]